MCRYAFHIYKEKYACFRCRKVFKQIDRNELIRPMRVDSFHQRLVPCPECGAPMKNMGLDFKAPRQADVRQWKKVEILYAHGINFASCGCGPGYRPATLREVPAFLAEKEREAKEAIRAHERYLRRQARANLRNARGSD